MTSRLLPFVLLLPLLGLAAAPPTAITIQASEAALSFPDRIHFTLSASSSSDIVVAEVEYGLETAACATDISRASPEDLRPAGRIETEWTWDMRQTGSLPPGARLWWRWHLVDAAGSEVRTPTETITWIDDVHPWQTITDGSISLHTYNATPTMSRQLLEAAVTGADRLASELGPLPADEVHLYIYDSTQAMADAILFEPQWTGGMAFSEFRTIILGIGEQDLEWGLNAVEHELAHVIVGNLVSACYARLPTWLSEGLAMVAEGGLDAESQRLLDEALRDDAFYPVRALSDGFTEDPGRASLAYAQSYSLVTYLLDTYGQDPMLALLEAAQAGYRADGALTSVYGVDSDGLDQAWRAWIGAPPSASAAPAAAATPTLMPTYPPVAAPPLAITTTPVPVPPPSSPPPSGAEGKLWYQTVLFSSIAVICLAICIPAAIVVVLVVILARRRRRAAASGGDGHA
ncbi:MAG: hypothetical protein FJZ97_04725 [Chloroflexi bacterium]|nr:hypothetical protein [Chloroflexota bacterium]